MILLLVLSLVAFQAHADLEHDGIRRAVVFPFKVEKSLDKEAENSWWDVRDRLTESRKFLVASKNFMQAKDVFQPRGELKPADAIILGRLLDANALVTLFVENGKLGMRVYETVNGLTLWTGDIEFHPAVPVSKQLEDLSRKLLYDFIAAVPYQGMVVIDNLIGRAFYSEGDRQLFKADVGIGSQITVGDTVVVFRIKADSVKPLFQDGLNMENYAEGIVTNVDRNIITVQVTRKAEGVDILSGALIRVPKELKRLQDIYSIHDDLTKNVSVSLIRDETPMSEKEKNRKPLVTSLAWLGNLVIVLLLAL